MMCLSLCGRVYSVLESSWLVPFDFRKHDRDWMLPPANDAPDGDQLQPLPHLETFKLVSPRQHTTTFCCTKTKNNHVQQCNNASLCLSKVGAQPPFQFEERRELYLYLCLSVCCCHASNLSDFRVCLFFLLSWGIMGGRVEWGLSYHIRILIVSI